MCIEGSCPAFCPPVPPSNFLQGYSQSYHPQSILTTRIVPTQVKVLALGLVAPWEVRLGLLLQLVQDLDEIYCSSFQAVWSVLLSSLLCKGSDCDLLISTLCLFFILRNAFFLSLNYHHCTLFLCVCVSGKSSVNNRLQTINNK